MQLEERRNLADFWVAGINYRKTDATIRGKFAINSEQYARVLDTATNNGLKELFILSTCNRTEIYGFASDVQQLIALLCTETAESIEVFKNLAYIKRGRGAVEHLFQVSAGLDSQVLGDYEIVGQMKVAAKFAKQRGFVGAFSERLINSALQASKAIKNNTQLSGGTVSVSFAAIQYIREHVPNYKKKHILLLGVGKIGRNTCKNLVDYLGTKNLTLINRTAEKAAALAQEFHLHHAPVEEMDQYIQQADIIITATSAQAPIINAAQLQGSERKVLIDLSIPYNIDHSVKQLGHIQLLNVDELSKLKDETLQMREAEVPKAKQIIADHIYEFTDWYEMRRNVPVLTALKKKLNQIGECALTKDKLTSEPTSVKQAQRIQKVINTTALKLKVNNTRGCHYIEAINEFIAR